MVRRQLDCLLHANLQAQGEAGAHRDRDSGEVGRLDVCAAERLLHSRIDRRLVRLLCEPWHDTTPAFVHARLGGQHLSEHLAIATDDRRAGVVAARLDAEDEPRGGIARRHHNGRAARLLRDGRSAVARLLRLVRSSLRAFLVLNHRLLARRWQRDIDAAGGGPRAEHRIPPLADRAHRHGATARLRPDAAQADLEPRRMLRRDELIAEPLRPLDEADVLLKGGREVDERGDLALWQPVRVEMQHVHARKSRAARWQRAADGRGRWRCRVGRSCCSFIRGVAVGEAEEVGRRRHLERAVVKKVAQEAARE